MSYQSPLIRKPLPVGSYQKIVAADAGWTHLNMEARLMQQGDTWTGNTGDNEYGFILLSGNFSATTSKGRRCSTCFTALPV